MSELKSVVLDYFNTYPVMTRSMLVTNVVGWEASREDLTHALDQLLAEGKLQRGWRPGKRRSTGFFFLAEHADRLEPFVKGANR